MINTENLQKSHENAQISAENQQFEAVSADLSADLSKRPIHELLAMRRRIDDVLPPRTLKQMNLEEELLLLYHQSKALLNDVVAEQGVPANQKAQVANTCAANLKELARLQLDVYKSERMKVIEQALVVMLKRLPEDQREIFVNEYERVYELMLPGAEPDMSLA